MTLTDAVAGMRKVADALEEAGSGQLLEFPESMLTGQAAVGAASFLCYLRDCLTASPKESWTRGELLVLLEICSRDGEIFPSGIGRLIYAMENDDD